MNPDNPNFRTKVENKGLFCHKCEKKNRVILKMGGLICAACRVILKDNGSKEWHRALDEMRKNENKVD